MIDPRTGNVLALYMKTRYVSEFYERVHYTAVDDEKWPDSTE